MTKLHPKILLVEDEPDVCSSLQSYFGRRGYQVSTTASGTEALTLIKVSKPDVVILDFALNDLNGQEVLRRLRQHDKKTKVIVLTGQMLPRPEIERIQSLGIVAYLTKPVILEKLAELVSQATGGIVTPEAPKVVKTTKTLARAGAQEEDDTRRAIVHKLSNLLGIIRNKCENFTLNLDDGVYKDKSQEELVKMSVDIMTDIVETVDQATSVVEKIKEK